MKNIFKKTLISIVIALSLIPASAFALIPLSVNQGGTGNFSFTPYAPIFGGTTSTRPLQSGTTGTTGQVLTSNGASALPTFQTLNLTGYVPYTGATSDVLLGTHSITASGFKDITNNGTYFSLDVLRPTYAPDGLTNVIKIDNTNAIFTMSMRGDGVEMLLGPAGAQNSLRILSGRTTTPVIGIDSAVTRFNGLQGLDLVEQAGNTYAFVGVGISSPLAKLHVRDNHGAQLRLENNAGNNLDVTINTTGSATLNLNGTSPEFTFSDKVNLSSGLKIGTSSTTGYVWTATDSIGNGSWQAGGGGGGGSPGGANTEIQFNDSGAFGGDNYFTWDKTGNILGLGIEAGVGKLYGVTATSANTTGGSLSFVTGNGLGSGDGGLFEIIGGNGGATGNGAEVRLIGGTGGATLGNGGGIKISGADAQTGTGGDGGRILFEIGAADGGGTNGYYGFTNLGGLIQTLNFDSVINPNTYTFPDKNGTLALLDSSTLGSVTVDNLILAQNTVTGTLGLNFINNTNDLYKFRSFTNTGIDAILDTSLVATSDKTYTLQNASGTLAFLSDITPPTLTSTYIGVGDGSNLLSGSSAFTYTSGLIKNTATTEQLRLGYNSTNYLSNTVSSNGSTAFAITSTSGTPTFSFNKELDTNLGTIPFAGQYAHRVLATDVITTGVYDISTFFGSNYTTQYWSASNRNPGIIEFDGTTQSFGFRSGNGGYTDIFGYNKLDLRTIAGQPVRIMNGATVNIQVTTGGNIELQDSLKLLTYGAGTHSGTATYTLQVDSSGNVIEGSPSGGITRSVNVISTNTTAGSTAFKDYVYIVSGTTTVTLPTAVGNTNRYTIKRTDATLTTTVSTTSSQTIDGASSYSLTSQYESIDLISDGSNWLII